MIIVRSKSKVRVEDPSTLGRRKKRKAFLKSKGKKERYKHLNAEFQRIPRREKKNFFSDQCK